MVKLGKSFRAAKDNMQVKDYGLYGSRHSEGTIMCRKKACLESVVGYVHCKLSPACLRGYQLAVAKNCGSTTLKCVRS